MLPLFCTGMPDRPAGCSGRLEAGEKVRRNSALQRFFALPFAHRLLSGTLSLISSQGRLVQKRLVSLARRILNAGHSDR